MQAHAHNVAEGVLGTHRLPLLDTATVTEVMLLAIIGQAAHVHLQVPST